MNSDPPTSSSLHMIFLSHYVVLSSSIALLRITHIDLDWLARRRSSGLPGVTEEAALACLPVMDRNIRVMSPPYAVC